MLRDANTIDPGSIMSVDIAVVGAGPAGLSLCLALDRAGIPSFLIESGGYSPDAFGDLLNTGTSDLDDYPFQASRARALGGSTTRWYGACVELDAADFRKRSWLPFSGWPIGPEDLAPYSAPARSFLGLPRSSSFEMDLERSKLVPSTLETKPVYYGNPLNLGRMHRRRVRDSTRITCLLHATVTEMTQDDTGRISCLTVHRRDGAQFDVRASRVVLAAGGLETPRLLLSSRSGSGAGVGNEHDNVGRYHMEHPIRSVGVLALGKQAASMRIFTDRTQVGSSTAQGSLGLSEDVRQTHNLLDFHARMYRFHPLESEPAVAAAKRLGLKLRASYSLAPIGKYFADYGFGVTGKLAQYAFWHIKNKLWAGAAFDHVRLLAFLEQEPDPENRVTLSQKEDRYGVPMPHLTFTESQFMRDSVRRSLSIIANAFKEAGQGTLRYDEDAVAPIRHYDSYGLHPMGSTRMSDSPETGVVNANLRVHSVPNLYIVGSSVFPTGGAANPTLTITQLALRLADHLSIVER